MENAPAFQMYPREWLVKTECFSPETRGLFLVLALFVWDSEFQDRIQNDDEMICMDLKISSETWESMKRIAFKKGILFEDENGFLVMPLHTKELVRQAERREKNQKNGAKGGRPKKEENQSDKSINPEKPNGYFPEPKKSLSSSSATSSSIASDLNSTFGAEAPKKLKPVPKEEAQEYVDLAKWMSEKLIEIDPNQKKPDFQKWAKDIRLLIESDRQDVESFKKAFLWGLSDSFWKDYVLEPAKVRKHWNTLSIKSKSSAKQSQSFSTALPGNQITPAHMRQSGVIQI